MALCLSIAVPAWLLGGLVPVVGGPVFSILLGMVLTLRIKDKCRLKLGISFTSKKILQYAVILLGFGMNLSVIASTGLQSLPIILTTIATSLLMAFALYKFLQIPTKISILIGVGSSVCGGSAIAATAPVIDANDEEIAQSISVIFLFNVIAALIFPALGEFLGMSDYGFGLFAGTAINDTDTFHHSHHAGAGILSNKKRGRKLCKGRVEKDLSVFYNLICFGLRSDDGLYEFWDSRHIFCAVQGVEQVFDRHGDGGDRVEYRYC